MNSRRMQEREEEVGENRLFALVMATVTLLFTLPTACLLVQPGTWLNIGMTIIAGSGCALSAFAAVWSMRDWKRGVRELKELRRDRN